MKEGAVKTKAADGTKVNVSAGGVNVKVPGVNVKVPTTAASGAPAPTRAVA